MKKEYKIMLVIILVAALILFFLKKKYDQLGALPKINRPPKIRLSYSRKLKPSERPKISSSNDAVFVLRDIWSSNIEALEEFIVLYLDRSNRVLGFDLLSKGGTAGTVVDPKIIFATALKSLSNAIIVAHNHPSGNTDPSREDLAITEKIKQVANYHGIQLLDHIIITKHDHFSFADNGKL